MKISPFHGVEINKIGLHRGGGRACHAPQHYGKPCTVVTHHEAFLTCHIDFLPHLKIGPEPKNDHKWLSINQSISINVANRTE